MQNERQMEGEKICKNNSVNQLTGSSEPIVRARLSVYDSLDSHVI